MSTSGVDDPSNASSNSDASRPSPLPEELSVLVVEDDPPARMLMAEILPPGWTVDVVSTADEARDAMAQNGYDVALIDIGLEGDHDGLKLLEAMGDDGHDTIKTIAVTAYALPGDRERILDAGFDYYVAKPFSKKHFLGAIATVLGSSA